MCSTTDDAVVVDLDFIRSAEGDNFGTHLDFESREVLTSSLRPLEVDVLERRVLARGADVSFDGLEWPTHGAVDAVLRQQDSSGEAPAFAEFALPEPNRVGICKRRELVEEQDFGLDD